MKNIRTIKNKNVFQFQQWFPQFDSKNQRTKENKKFPFLSSAKTKFFKDNFQRLDIQFDKKFRFLSFQRQILTISLFSKTLFRCQQRFLLFDWKKKKKESTKEMTNFVSKQNLTIILFSNTRHLLLSFH